MQCDAQNTKHWVKERHIMISLMQMSFKFLHSAATTGFGVIGLIRLGKCITCSSTVNVEYCMKLQA
jgi:hypothetical protein